MTHAQARVEQPSWRLAARLWWAFTWRVAVWAFASTGVIGVTAWLLVRGLGVPGGWVYRAIPYITFLSLFAGQVDAFRRLSVVFDIRSPGDRAHEQERRHRR